jgi:hypothetical protein
MELPLGDRVVQDTDAGYFAFDLVTILNASEPGR